MVVVMFVLNFFQNPNFLILLSLVLFYFYVLGGERHKKRVKLHI